VDANGGAAASIGLIRFQWFSGSAGDDPDAVPGGGTDAATAQDVSLAHSFPCVGTSWTSAGSFCNPVTSANAIVAGAVQQGMRSVWEFDDVRIYDGGADGDGDTTADNTVFLRPGVFIP
jgi:hypothetical protein